MFNYSDSTLTSQPTQAIAIGAHNSGSTCQNIQIFNNTFRGGAQAVALGDDNGVIAPTCHIVNNLRYTPGTGGINLRGSNQAVMSNNATAPDSSFVTAANGNFRLSAAASTAINQGTSSFVSTITNVDAAGVTRPQGGLWDIGAYEYSSSTPTPTPPPVATPTPAASPTPTPAASPTPTPAPSPTPTPAASPTPTPAASPTPTPAAISGVTIWPSSATPSTVDVGPDEAVELGVRFRSDVAGTIRGIRFYKANTNTGTHVGSLWSSTGTLLASAAFTGESASGWQQVNFATPVAINPNTVYVASYHTNTGHYSFDANYFASSGEDNPPLHALGSSAGGGNGVYVYGADRAFPTQTWNNSNYWVDIVFQPQAQQTPTPAPSPTPSQVTSFEAESGSLSGPFIVSNGSVLQSSETSLSSSGRASYTFSISNAGDYVVEATVNAPNDSYNSLYVNIDEEPTDPVMIWDIPITSGFERRSVNWRGGGTYDSNQYVPRVFTLSPGSHQLIIRGREGNVRFDRLSILRR